MFFRLLICSTTQSQVLLSWFSSNCLLACWYSFRIAAAQPLKMMLFLKLAWAGRGAVSAMTAKTIIPHCGFMAPSFLFQQQLKPQCVVMADSHSVIIFFTNHSVNVGIGVVPFIASVIPDLMLDQKICHVDVFRNDPWRLVLISRLMRVCSREVLCRVPTTLRRSPTSGKTVAPEIGISSAQQTVGPCHLNVSEPRQISRQAEEVR